MTDAIVLGKTDEGNDVVMNLLQLVATRLLIFAGSGGGKSWLIRRILEQSFKLIQQIVLDVEGDFYTLREKFAYVLASANDELNPDMPLNVDMAQTMARMIMELRISIIIDLSSLEPEHRVTFVKNFANALLDMPRKLRNPVLCVIDEVQEFCDDNEEIESTAALKRLALLARKRGICPIYATQALAQVNKRAIAQCHNKIIGLASLDIDVRRAADNLGFAGREDKNSIEELSTGEFFARGPAISRKVVKVKIGDVVTTHPKAGEDITPPKPVTDAAMSKAIQALQSAVKSSSKTASSEKSESRHHERTHQELAHDASLASRYNKLLEEASELRTEVKTLREVVDEKNKAIEQLSTQVAESNTTIANLQEQLKNVSHIKDRLNQLVRDALDIPADLDLSAKSAVAALAGASEIQVEQAAVTVVERQVTKPDIDESTMPGKIAILGAEGFFDQGRTTQEIYNELSRRYDLGMDYDSFRKNSVGTKALTFWANRPYGYFDNAGGRTWAITELGKKYLHKRREET